MRVVVAAAIALLLSPTGALAQQAGAPVPLYPGAEPRSFEQHPLPPPTPSSAPTPPGTPASSAPAPAPPSADAAAGAPGEAPPPPPGRVFCEQPVTVQLADPGAVAPRYRPFVGIWSDASWTPDLCAALIVENITADGTATIVYAFGPMGANVRGAGGVLNGTGVIQDGELRFENADGSQFVFRPLYADLQGRLTTPQGQRYEAIFKKAL